LINGVEDASDQKGPPPHHDLSLSNDGLNIVKREIRPRRGEVIKYFQRFHGGAVSDKGSLDAHCLLAPLQVLWFQTEQGVCDSGIRRGLTDGIWQSKANVVRLDKMEWPGFGAA
jgi:hypothetical protein